MFKNIFKKTRKKTVNCPVKILFDIMESDMKQGLCTTIDFILKDKEHQLGVWGDGGVTTGNKVFYLDKQEYSSMDELKRNAMIDGVYIVQMEEFVTVTECNGCYPDSTPQLAVYID